MVEMFVSSLTLDPATKMPFLIMKDKDSRYSLPIWIGIFEASAIAMQLEGIKPERPMTHDLMCNVISGLDIVIDRVEIRELKDSTFFATLFLRRADGTFLEIDSRPSDSIALALRFNAPVMISEDVIIKARRIDLTKCSDDSMSEKDKWTDILESMTPEAFGKYKM